MYGMKMNDDLNIALNSLYTFKTSSKTGGYNQQNRKNECKLSFNGYYL